MRIKKITKFRDKLIGLSFKNRITPIFFKTRWGIHTLFVKEAIDVFICDENFIVKKITRNLKPGNILFWNPRYKNIFEVPAGFKEFKNVKLGEKLESIGL